MRKNFMQIAYFSKQSKYLVSNFTIKSKTLAKQYNLNLKYFKFMIE